MSHVVTILQLTDAFNKALSYLEAASREAGDPARRIVTLKYVDAGRSWAQSVTEDIMKEALPGETD